MPVFILVTNCFTCKYLHNQCFIVTQQVFKIISCHSNKPNLSKYKVFRGAQVRHILLVLEQSLIQKNADDCLLALHFNVFNIFSKRDQASI